MTKISHSMNYPQIEFWNCTLRLLCVEDQFTKDIFTLVWAPSKVFHPHMCLLNRKIPKIHTHCLELAQNYFTPTGVWWSTVRQWYTHIWRSVCSFRLLYSGKPCVSFKYFHFYLAINRGCCSSQVFVCFNRQIVKLKPLIQQEPW